MNKLKRLISNARPKYIVTIISKPAINNLIRIRYSRAFNNLKEAKAWPDYPVAMKTIKHSWGGYFGVAFLFLCMFVTAGLLMGCGLVLGGILSAAIVGLACLTTYF